MFNNYNFNWWYLFIGESFSNSTLHVRMSEKQVISVYNPIESETMDDRHSNELQKKYIMYKFRCSKIITIVKRCKQFFSPDKHHMQTDKFLLENLNNVLFSSSSLLYTLLFLHFITPDLRSPLGHPNLFGKPSASTESGTIASGCLCTFNLKNRYHSFAKSGCIDVYVDIT